ncbi:hypothetical protein SDC9_157689 [bioreactor metagenome]|uniref:Uncharacterized protein n=1 Tax=bioreactor metagenome TaxID=1076179 RepID=A0A645FD27_9ZZZZ
MRIRTPDVEQEVESRPVVERLQRHDDIAAKVLDIGNLRGILPYGVVGFAVDYGCGIGDVDRQHFKSGQGCRRG